MVPPRVRIEHPLSNLGNRADILVIAVRRLFLSPALEFLVDFFPAHRKKRGPVPSDGVVFAAWPARLSPQSARLTE